MVEERPFCPECGDPLSIATEKDDETGEIMIDFFCEGAGDDEYHLRIQTRLTDVDLKGLKKVGKTMKRQMVVELMNRKPEPYSKV
ncbi:hypothetical protein GTO27_13550 [Candidatus Bathyarchaeota archaeon]|nr:hypothetical protein [Candidatus Bathyarchaeota archaeon]